VPTELTSAGPRLLALDGLRGIAVSLVLAAHFIRGDGSGRWAAAERVASTGWIGVDLFFVLSGFLITRILIRTKGEPHYFLAFYLRRALRILPLFYGFIVLLLILPRLWLVSDWLGRAYLVHHQGWFWSYGMNWLMVRESVLGTVPSATDYGFGTFWSLAIEEQFYLVWPFVIALIPLRHLTRVIIGLAVASIAISVILASSGAPIMVLYYSTPTRLCALSVGALLAVFECSGGLSSYTRNWSLAAILSAILLLASTPLLGKREYGNALFFAVLLPVLAVAFGALLLKAMENGVWRSGLMNPALRHLGRRSYAIYLLQAPIQHIMLGAGVGPERVGTPAFLLIGIGMTLLLSWASWNLWEVHFLRLKTRLSWARIGARAHEEVAT
jgi:peptidoglycan/LPS O-acetylase OafA/YrhL